MKAMTFSPPSSSTFARPGAAILVARRDVVALDQDRRERLAPPGVAADRQRTERVAVVALPARDEMPAPRFPALDVVLARHLQRRLDRLRAAGDEIDVREIAGRVRCELVGERLGGRGSEEAGVRVLKPLELRAHRGEHLRMLVPEAGHRRATARVEVALALRVDQVDAFAACRYRIAVM